MARTTDTAVNSANALRAVQRGGPRHSTGPNVVDHAADGYVATVVSGQVIAENGMPTSARPGRLVRGKQSAPA